jgi:nicotinamide phosphoribosyltransferase
MTALGPEGEAAQFKRVLEAYPTGIVSIVSDSYDIYKAAEEIVGEQLKDLVLSRDGVTVIRPDSGDPISTVLRLLDILGDKFGTTQTESEYDLLNPKIRLIWGDGINADGIEDILSAMKENYWSADNIVFGMGGGLLQKVNRDTQRFAFKCSAARRNGEWFDIYKDPIDQTKRSKRGKLALVKGTAWEKNFHTVESLAEDRPDDILETVFEDGVLLRDMKFDEVRANAALETRTLAPA